MYRIFHSLRSKAAAVIPVVIDRIIGILILFFLGFLAAIVSFYQHRNDISLLGIIVGFSGSFLFLLILCLLIQENSYNWLLKNHYIPSKMKKVIEHLGEYHRQQKTFFHFIAVSILFYLILFFYSLLLIRAIGEPCSVFSLSLVMMLSIVIATLPISINGIGLMDGSFIYLISKFGVAYESAVIFMLLYRALSTGISLLGGFSYYTTKDSFRVKDIRKASMQSPIEPI